MEVATESFLSNIFEARYWLYPLQGFGYAMWINLFWKEMTLIFLTYLSKLTLVSVFYYLLLFPFVLGINTVMWGPLGITVAVVHAILQVNMYASTLTRLHSAKYAPLIMEKLVRAKNSNNAIVASRIFMPTVQRAISAKPKRHLAKAVPIFLAKMTLKLSFYSLIFMVSLIPIAGVFLVRIIRSGTVGYLYSIPILAVQKPLSLKKGEIFYRDLGKNVAFGVVGGFLELLPIFSGLCIATNYIGRGLWLLDESAKLEPGVSPKQFLASL
ncbi:LAFA_0C08680g1_1 [Lachancea sp. 'fantastica']|nr:LAFA_0C08680g1_1 [Lachancea sp. 'fantastica']